MDIESFRNYCLAKKGVTEGFPFDEDTLVFKVMGKMFALTSLSDQPFSANLKCDPDWSLELRESYDAIYPGFHMNKKHWNTVVMDGQVPAKLEQKLIDHSYELVVAKLPKRDREALNDLPA
jgi:predicted DNA-binding protein (MmcQ/YjbR family)